MQQKKNRLGDVHLAIGVRITAPIRPLRQYDGVYRSRD